MLSYCCDAEPWLGTDLCSECKEHADFYDEEATQEEIDAGPDQ